MISHQILDFSDCWKSDAHERPLIPHILRSLEKIACSDFPETAADSFRSMQESWKHEIERIFEELKEREEVSRIASEDPVSANGERCPWLDRAQMAF